MRFLVTLIGRSRPHLSRATRILVTRFVTPQQLVTAGSVQTRGCHRAQLRRCDPASNPPRERHPQQAESRALVCLRKIAGLLTCRRRRQRRRILSRCYGVGVAVVGNVWVWAAAEAAESLTVPLARRCLPMRTAMRTPTKLITAMTHDAAASPDASASEAGWPAAVRSEITAP